MFFPLNFIFCSPDSINLKDVPNIKVLPWASLGIAHRTQLSFMRLGWDFLRIRCNMKKRTEYLYSLVGNYSYKPDLTRLPLVGDFLRFAQVCWKDDTPFVGGMRLSKFLAKAGIDNNYISGIMEGCKVVHFSVSVRFKDILRSSDSKHFSSCVSSGHINREVFLKNLNDPYWAVALRRDSSGAILGRCWLRQGQVTGDCTRTDAVIVYPAYGRIDTEMVAETIGGWVAHPYRGTHLFQSSPPLGYSDCSFPMVVRRA